MVQATGSKGGGHSEGIGGGCGVGMRNVSDSKGRGLHAHIHCRQWQECMAMCACAVWVTGLKGSGWYRGGGRGVSVYGAGNSRCGLWDTCAYMYMCGHVCSVGN